MKTVKTIPARKPDIVEICCKVCGKSMKVQVPEEATGETRAVTLKLIAATGAHDHCADAHSRQCNQRDVAYLEAARAQEWGGICPPLYQDTDPAKLEALIGETRFNLIEAWGPDGGGTGLLFYGRTGRGKTRAMFHMLKRLHLTHDGIGISALTHGDFATRCMGIYREETLFARWIKVLCSVDILLVDDLGKGKFARADGEGSIAEEQLFVVFERRITAKLPTLWTTENSGKDLRARLSAERGESFIRRIREFSETVDFND